MEWSTYKQLSHDPEYFTRVALNRTAAFVNQRIAAILIQFTQTKPLEKPHDHKGGSETDVFKISLKYSDVSMLLAELEAARVRLKLEQGSTQPNLGPLIARWQEYADWQQKSTVELDANSE